MAGPALSRIALCTCCLDSGTEYVSDAGMRTLWVVLLASALLQTPCAHAVKDVPVPSACNASVNQRLADLLAQQPKGTVDNVMVCGVTVSPSRTQSGGPHGSHQILPLLVNVPGVGTKLVEVVTNDDLDGVVTAPKGAQVFAYGQAFFPSRGRFAAGIHDVHCATHRGADNGWVVVNGVKAPASCGPR
jgi:hypothetical protein